MSASLVGSEMCIRDSGSAVLVHAFFEAGRDDELSMFAGVVSCSSGIPVSYTHLTLPTICSV
eukprot:731428-Alexandrium_andersonii.AAC.1